MDGFYKTSNHCNLKLRHASSYVFIKNQSKLAIVKWGGRGNRFMEVEGAFEDTAALILWVPFT